jgi:hypothetical protein
MGCLTQITIAQGLVESLSKETIGYRIFSLYDIQVQCWSSRATQVKSYFNTDEMLRQSLTSNRYSLYYECCAEYRAGFLLEKTESMPRLIYISTNRQ